MKIAKVLGVVLLVLVVIFSFIGFQAPTKLEIVRTAEIDAPKVLVKEYLVSLKKMQEWSAWAKMDTNTVNVYEGEEGAVGSKNSWTSEITGRGIQEITAITDTSVSSTITFLEPWEAVNQAEFRFHEKDGKTLVKWTLIADAPFPSNIFMTLKRMESSIGNDFESGLENLNALAKEAAKNRMVKGFLVKEFELPSQVYLIQKSTVSFQKMEEFMNGAFVAVQEEIKKQGLTVLSPEAGLYFGWDEKNGVTTAGYGWAVSENAVAPKGFELVNVSGKVASIDFYGDPSKSAEAHYALDEYLSKNNLKSTLVMEHHVTDRKTEADLSKWLTRIIYPVVQAGS